MLNAQTVNGSEFIHEHTVEVADFTRVNLEGKIDVFYTQSENNSITIMTMHSQHINNVYHNIRNNTLTIRNGGRRRFGITRMLFGENKNTTKIQVFIESPSIERFSKSGSGAITFLDSVSLDQLNFHVSGISNINIPYLDVNDLEIRSSGFSRANIAGNAENVRVSSSGSYNLNLENLVSTKVRVSISGSGTVNVHSTDELNVSSSGSGRVNYRGNPSMNVSVSGSGRVRRIVD